MPDENHDAAADSAAVDKAKAPTAEQIANSLSKGGLLAGVLGIPKHDEDEPANRPAKPEPKPAKPTAEKPAEKPAAKPAAKPAKSDENPEDVPAAKPPKRFNRPTPAMLPAKPAEKAAEEAEKPDPDVVREERLAKAVAGAVAEVVRPLTPAARPAPAPAPGPQAEEPEAAGLDALPEAYQKDVPVYRELARINPEKYGEEKLAAGLLEFERKAADYQRKWEKANPGLSFDIEDAEHAEFLDKNSVEIDAADLETAQAAARKAPVRVAASTAPKPAAKPAPQAEQKPDPLAERLVQEADAQARRDGEQFVQAAAEAIGLKASDELDSLADAEPLTAQMLSGMLPSYSMLATEMRRLMAEAVKFDASNPIHNDVLVLLQQAQQGVQESGQTDWHGSDGVTRKFLPYAEFMKLPAAKRSMFWTTDADYMADFVKEHLKENVAARVKMVREAVAKQAGKPASNGEAKPRPPVAMPRSKPSTLPGRTVVDAPPAKQPKPTHGMTAFFRGIGALKPEN